MLNSNTIHIVLTCDDAYAQHAGVVLASIKEQLRPGSRVQSHILDAGITPTNRQYLQDLADDRLLITLYSADMNEYNSYFVSGHVSKATYLRLSMETVLPPEITRVIYLDCDLVVLQPLDTLWQTELGGRLLAAVKDPGKANRLRPDLGIDQPGMYFNSGVMLLDLAAWRAQDVSRRVKEYLQANWSKLIYWDQDGLNAVLHRDWLPVDKTWNTFSYAAQAQDRPAIVHFVAPIKPWLYQCADSYQKDYLKYLRQTPWKDYQFPDKNVINWLKRKVLAHAPRPLIRGIKFFTLHWRYLTAWCSRKLSVMASGTS